MYHSDIVTSYYISSKIMLTRLTLDWGIINQYCERTVVTWFINITAHPCTLVYIRWLVHFDLENES
jgi:hypothetical protein